MKAYQLTAWQTPPEMRDVAVPEPGPGQVLIKVGGAGACHSDLHLMEWPRGHAGASTRPSRSATRTPAGSRRSAPGSRAWRRARRSPSTGPGAAAAAAPAGSRRENYCERQAEIGAFGGGLGLDGGMAEYMLVPHPRLLLPLGDLDPRDAAPLSDAALTPYHAIKRSLHLLVPGSTAVVIGVGGLGHMGVQILRALSPARIVAVDVSAEKLRAGARGRRRRDRRGRRGRRGGDPRAHHGPRRRAGRSTWSAPTTRSRSAPQVARFESHVTIVGLAGGKFEFAFGALPFEAQLSHPLLGHRGRAGGGASSSPAPARSAPTSSASGSTRAADAYARMRDGTLDGRAVICPHG